MPIIVTCPACRTKLSAPDAAAGKKVKCPKTGCGTIIPVAAPAPPPPALEVIENKPAFEVVDEPPPPPAKKKPAKAILDEDPPQADDGDDDRATEPEPKRTRFRPKPYKADGGFNPISLPILLFALCLAAVALGWLASFLGQWFYLIALFPLGIGFGIALVGWVTVLLTKMRNVYVAAGLGLVSGVVAMVSMHYFDYLRAKAELVAELRRIENDLNAGQAAQLRALKDVKEMFGFGTYMDMQATEGVSITKAGQKDGINLGFAGTWIYWVLELLWVAFMTTAGIVVGSMSPFCTECETWKDDQPLGTLDVEGDDIVRVLKKGDVAALTEHDPAPEGGNVVLTAYVCPNCKTDASIVIKVEELKPGSKKGEEQKKERAKLVYPGKALAAFKEVFKASSKPPSKPSKKKKPVVDEEDE